MSNEVRGGNKIHEVLPGLLGQTGWPIFVQLVHLESSGTGLTLHLSYQKLVSQ
jgi:hypothetical protein